jgi:hypothetical protein
MPFYFYFYIAIVLIIVVLVIRWFVLQKKNIPVVLFDKALKSENSGQYEEALLNYENALREVKKIKYHKDLKIKITAKLKVMRTIIDYQNNFQRPEIVVAVKAADL